MKAFCSGCSLSSVPSPSSVVTSLPSIEPTGVTQERLAAPLTSTVQAPHCVMAQPYLAPLSSRSLRSTYSSGVSGSASTERVAPLTFRLMAIAGVLPDGRVRCAFLRERLYFASARSIPSRPAEIESFHSHHYPPR